jgi:hypothetical protein
MSSTEQGIFFEKQGTPHRRMTVSAIGSKKDRRQGRDLCPSLTQSGHSKKGKSGLLSR